MPAEQLCPFLVYCDALVKVMASSLTAVVKIQLLARDLLPTSAGRACLPGFPCIFAPWASCSPSKLSSLSEGMFRKNGLLSRSAELLLLLWTLSGFIDLVSG